MPELVQRKNWFKLITRGTLQAAGPGRDPSNRIHPSRQRAMLADETKDLLAIGAGKSGKKIKECGPNV